MRLIDAEPLHKALIDHIKRVEELGFSTTEARVLLFNVDNAPTIEAEPVKHGKWEKKGISIKGIEKEFCSECKTWSYGRNKAYCPNCGAKMDEVKE